MLNIYFNLCERNLLKKNVLLSIDATTEPNSAMTRSHRTTWEMLNIYFSIYDREKERERDSEIEKFIEKERSLSFLYQRNHITKLNNDS